MKNLSKEEKLKILQQFEGRYIDYNYEKTFKKSYMILTIDFSNKNESLFRCEYVYIDAMTSLYFWEDSFNKMLHFLIHETNKE